MSDQANSVPMEEHFLTFEFDRQSEVWKVRVPGQAIGSVSISSLASWRFPSQGYECVVRLPGGRSSSEKAKDWNEVVRLINTENSSPKSKESLEALGAVVYRECFDHASLRSASNDALRTPRYWISRQVSREVGTSETAHDQALRSPLPLELAHNNTGFLARETRWIHGVSGLTSGSRLADFSVPEKSKVLCIGYFAKPAEVTRLEEHSQDIKSQLRESSNLAWSDKSKNGCSLNEAQALIREAEYEILYIVCHGDKEESAACLLEFGEGITWAAPDFCEAIKQRRDRLGKAPIVILGACWTGGSLLSYGSQLARDLIIKASVPAVFATSGVIPTTTAFRLMKKFFSELAQGQPLDEAARRARADHYGADLLSFLRCALYAPVPNTSPTLSVSLPSPQVPSAPTSEPSAVPEPPFPVNRLRMYARAGTYALIGGALLGAAAFLWHSATHIFGSPMDGSADHSHVNAAPSRASSRADSGREPSCVCTGSQWESGLATASPLPGGWAAPGQVQEPALKREILLKPVSGGLVGDTPEGSRAIIDNNGRILIISRCPIRSLDNVRCLERTLQSLAIFAYQGDVSKWNDHRDLMHGFICAGYTIYSRTPHVYSRVELGQELAYNNRLLDCSISIPAGTRETGITSCIVDNDYYRNLKISIDGKPIGRASKTAQHPQMPLLFLEGKSLTWLLSEGRSKEASISLEIDGKAGYFSNAQTIAFEAFAPGVEKPISATFRQVDPATVRQPERLSPSSDVSLEILLSEVSKINPDLASPPK